MRHLAVGLVDQQIRVINVIPESAPTPELDLTGDIVKYRGSPSRWRNFFAARSLIEQLRQLEPDLVHAMDAPARALAGMIGRALRVPVVCGCWSRRSALKMGRLSRRSGEPVATTGPLSHLVRQRVSHVSNVVTVRPGVYSFDEAMPEPLSDPEAALSALVVGPPRGQALDPALLYGLAQSGARLNSIMMFISASAEIQHQYWLAARRLNLLSQINLVPRAAGTTRLLMQCDVLIQPQVSGHVRTITLGAMAAGRPVLAATDPDLDYLIDERTACLLHDPNARRWTDQLADLAVSPAKYRELGQAARRYVAEHHSVSRFVDGMLDVYRTLAPESFRFDQTPVNDDGEAEPAES